MGGGSQGGNWGGQSGQGGATMGGPSTKAGRGPKGYQRSDDRIREDVCEHLTQHPEIDASEIEVKVENGQVTLSGSIDDRMAKRRIEDIVEGLSGVKDVQNQIRVGQAGTTGNAQGGSTSGNGSQASASGSQTGGSQTSSTHGTASQSSQTASSQNTGSQGTHAQASMSSKDDDGSQSKKK
jgi:hypothetical protein